MVQTGDDLGVKGLLNERKLSVRDQNAYGESLTMVSLVVAQP